MSSDKLSRLDHTNERTVDEIDNEIILATTKRYAIQTGRFSP